MKWVDGPQYPTPQMRTRLVSVLQRIYHDFDHRLGAFQGLTYYSPRDFADEYWSSRTGLSVESLADAITAWRQSRECGVSASDATLATIQALRQAVATWIAETGYERKPTGLRNLPRFNAIPATRGHLFSSLESLSLRNISVDYDGGTVDAFGAFMDTIGHRASFLIEVKYKYGGKLYARMGFPYYGDGAPSRLTDFFLLGEGLFYHLQLDPPPDVVRIVDQHCPPFPRLDGFLAIFEAAMTYLRD